MKALLKAPNPQDMLKKIVEGKMQNFYEEVCLIHQKFIKNNKISIQQYLDAFSKKHTNKATIKRFVRFAIAR